MSPDNHSKRSQTSSERVNVIDLLRRLVLVGIVIVALGTASLLVIRYLNLSSGPTVQISLSPNPALNPLQAGALRAYLLANQGALDTPANPEAGPVVFTIEPGQTAGQVADNLQAQGLVTDAALLRSYLRYYGLDVQIEAGTYELSASMTVPELAYALTEARPPEMVVRITEGWRREQIANWLDQQADLPFGGAEFLAASHSSAAVRPDSSLAGVLPPGATLEGFLFPDTYRLAIDATADDLVQRMLETFDQRVTPELRAEATARGMTLYQVVTLAAIVEREAVVAEERPIIASVYLNRLAAGMKLEADPTVQYAMGYQADSGQWWNLNLTQSDYASVDSPYNTYLYPGLPPGPIASPGLDSIQAVIVPAQTPYLFFRTTCDGSGRHNFAVTFEEHLANACQ